MFFQNFQRSAQPNVPSPRFSGTFTWHDVSPRYLVSDEGHTVRCIRSGPITVYSKEVFRGTAEVEYTLAIRDLQGGPVAFGLFSASCTDACRSALLGSDELGMSVGCGVGGNNVVIAHRSRVLHQGRCNSSTPVFVTMKLRNGRVKFSVDGDECECAELSCLDLSSGEYRLGCSMANEGQCATLKDSSTDGAALLAADDLGVSLEIHDRWRSIDVVSRNPDRLKCKHSCRATAYTKTIYSGTDKLVVELNITNQGDDFIGLGLIRACDGDEGANHLAGEKELKDSVSVLVNGKSVTILHADEFVFKTEMADLSSNPTLIMHLHDGRVSFRVAGRDVVCSKLHNLSFAGVSVRVAVPMSESGQEATITRLPALPPSTGLVIVDGRDAKTEIEYDARSGFTFSNNLRSIDAEGTSVKCVRDFKATVASQQWFKGSTDLRVTVRFSNRGMGAVALGLFSSDSTETASHEMLGNPHFKGSIGCFVLPNNVVCIRRQGGSVSEHSPSLSDTVDITLILHEGVLRFEVYGQPIECPKLSSLSFGDGGKFRLGISMSKPGQTARIVTGPVLTAPPPSNTLLAMHDRWTAIDVVERNPDQILCKMDVRSSVYSTTTYRGDDELIVQMNITNRGSDFIGLGLFKAGDVDECRNRLMGEKEIADSVGVLIDSERLTILHKDKFIFRASSSDMSSTPCLVMHLTGGRVKFFADGCELKCTELEAISFAGMELRVGLSMSKSGQAATISRLLAMPQMPSSTVVDSLDDTCVCDRCKSKCGRDYHHCDKCDDFDLCAKCFATKPECDSKHTAFTHKSGDAARARLLSFLRAAMGQNDADDAEYKPNGGGFTFHDNLRSIRPDGDGPRVKCVIDYKATVASRQWFSGSTNLRVTAKFANRSPGAPVAFGLFGHQHADQGTNHMLGDKNFNESIGCFIMPGNTVVILFKEEPLFATSSIPLTSEPEITLILQDGSLRFEVNGHALDCGRLALLGFNKGKFRLGISLSEPGQTARLLDAPTLSRHVPISHSSEPWTWRDDLQSMNVDGSRVCCVADFAATMASHQWFQGSTDQRVTVRFAERANGIVAFGILPKDSTVDTRRCVLGDAALPSSVGCLIMPDDSIVIQIDGELAFTAPCPTTPSQPEITVVLENGTLSFEVNGEPCACEALKTRSFNDEQLLLGISLCAQGQQARVVADAFAPEEGVELLSSTYPYPRDIETEEQPIPIRLNFHSSMSRDHNVNKHRSEPIPIQLPMPPQNADEHWYGAEDNRGALKAVVVNTNAEIFNEPKDFGVKIRVHDVVHQDWQHDLGPYPLNTRCQVVFDDIVRSHPHAKTPSCRWVIQSFAIYDCELDTAKTLCDCGIRSDCAATVVTEVICFGQSDLSKGGNFNNPTPDYLQMLEVATSTIETIDRKPDVLLCHAAGPPVEVHSKYAFDGQASVAFELNVTEERTQLFGLGFFSVDDSTAAAAVISACLFVKNGQVTMLVQNKMVSFSLARTSPDPTKIQLRLSHGRVTFSVGEAPVPVVCDALTNLCLMDLRLRIQVVLSANGQRATATVLQRDAQLAFADERKNWNEAPLHLNEQIFKIGDRVRVNDLLFEVTEHLGNGGCGGVAKIQHTREKAYAIKRPLKEKYHKLARDEANMMSLIPKHPNIVEFIGIADCGAIIVEYIEGTTLHKYLKTTIRVPVKVRLQMVLQVCNALTTLHKKRIYHLDVTPRNIMVTPEEDAVKLIDFGLSKTDTPDGSNAITAGFGTPAYAPPEQFMECEDARYGPHSDVYALAGVLYFAFVRCDPTVKGKSREDIRKELVNCDCPPDLADAICRCLEREYNSRLTLTQLRGCVLQHAEAPTPDVTLLHVHSNPRLSQSVHARVYASATIDNFQAHGLTGLQPNNGANEEGRLNC